TRLLLTDARSDRAHRRLISPWHRVALFRQENLMSIPTRPMLVATVLCAVTSHGAAQSSAGTPSPEPAVAQLPALTITAPRTPDHSTLTQPDLPQARRELHRTPGGAGVVEA